MKKFSALLICLLMIITCGLAGCATFSIDRVKYYNEVLAKVDDTKITRFDLINAYNSYGNTYYVQQMGQSEKKALKNTLDLLIEREALYQYALDNNDLYKPSAYQVNTIVEEMFDSMDEQMESYIKKAKEILDIETDEKEDTAEDNDETAYKLEDYTYKKRANVKYNEETEKYYIEYIVEEDEEIFEKLLDDQYLNNFNSKNIEKEIKNKYFEHLLDELELTEDDNATAIYNKARSLFAKDLISYEYYLRDENGNKYDKVNENLFNRYFKRTFENQIQSQYLENIRVYYLKNEELSIELIKKEYEYLSTVSFNSYDKNHTAYKDKMKDIGTGGDTVLYHPTTDTEFGYFIHTLISFDSIKDNLSKLDNYLGEDKDEIYHNIVTSIKQKPRDLETGLIDEDAEEKSLSQILEEYEAIRTGKYDSEAARMSAFIQFMFKYTGDTATLSQGMPYVVGTNGYSAMVEEFNNEAIKLMTGKNEEGQKVMDIKVGNMSTTDLTNLDNMCITEYGIHLLYYVGNVNSFDIPHGDVSNVYIQTENKYIHAVNPNDPSDSDYYVEDEMFNLYTKTINPLTKETYFDMMFDTVYPASSSENYTSNTGYTDYEEQLAKLSKKQHKVTKYSTKIKATKISL